MEKKLTYTVKEAAEVAGVSTVTMLGWVKQSDFPAFRVGKKYLIPARMFEGWIEAQAAARAQTVEADTTA